MRHKIGWIQYAVKSDWLKIAFFSSSYLSKYLVQWWCRTSNLSKKINFTNFFFRYCCCSDILSLNGSTGPPTKFQSLNDTALTSIYGQTYGKIVLQFFDTILWKIKVEKSLEHPRCRYRLHTNSFQWCCCSYTNAWKQCAICFIFMRLKRRSFLMTQTKPIVH